MRMVEWRVLGAVNSIEVWDWGFGKGNGNGEMSIEGLLDTAATGVVDRNIELDEYFRTGIWGT